MGNTFFFGWEVKLMQTLQAHMGPLSTGLATLFTMLGEELVLIAIVGYLYWCYDKKLARSAALGIAGCLVFCPMIKNVALRRRPYFDHAGISALRPVDKSADIYDIAAQGYSFPSMHSSNSASLFGSIALCLGKRWAGILAAVLTIGVGFSRICLGVHYPTDVLVGWGIGLLFAVGMKALSRRVKNDNILFTAILLLALPGFFFCRSDDFFSAYGVVLGVFVGFLFEERFVHFKPTRDPLESVLRVAGGGMAFLALTTVLKKLFALTGAQGMAAQTLRMLRYALCGFAIIGVYPLCFRKIRIGTKK